MSCELFALYFDEAEIVLLPQFNDIANGRYCSPSHSSYYSVLEMAMRAETGKAVEAYDFDDREER